MRETAELLGVSYITVHRLIKRGLLRSSLLHEEFDDLRINKVNYRKEFFRLPLGRIKEFVAAKGLNAAFTMLADAHEFRETEALAKMTPEERDKYHLRALPIAEPPAE